MYGIDGIAIFDSETTDGMQKRSLELGANVQRARTSWRGLKARWRTNIINLSMFLKDRGDDNFRIDTYRIHIILVNLLFRF